MPDISDIIFIPDDPEIFDPPPPQALQFVHRTVSGVSQERDTIEFPWYWTRLDHPALNDRPQAILTVTPMGRIEINDEARTANLVHNAHPVGVVFRRSGTDQRGRWYIYNLNFAAMAARVDFHVAIHEARRPEQ